MSVLIKNARVIDPINSINSQMDVYINNGVIESLNPGDVKADKEIDASGLVLCPGLVDLHVHFRTPGYEHKENYKTGSHAAAAGGFTTVCTMANTNPIIDDENLIKKAVEIAENEAVIRVLPVGAITKGFAGKDLVDIENMLESGAVGFSEDGISVFSDDLMKDILKMSKTLNFPVICHCEDPNFKHGVVNEGEISNKLGVKGIPHFVEEKIVERDLNIAKKFPGYLHLTHNSTAGSIKLIRQAKKDGVNVTCDVTPHHFSLDETYAASGDTNFKMNPPLRSQEDIDEIISGIVDNTIDCIATDHAPHAEEEKNQSIEKAPFGIIGLETALSVGITYLVNPGHIDLKRLIELMSINPAKIIGLEQQGIKAGAAADLTIFSPDEEIVFAKEGIKSKSINSPYLGMKLTGAVKYTIYNGEIVFDNGKILE